MPHKPQINPGETVDAFLRRVESEHAAGGGDGDVKLPLSIQPIGGGVGMLVDADGVPVVGDDGMPILRNMDTPGTGGTAPTQFASQAALDEAQTRLANANAALVELEAQGQQPISPFQQAQLDIQRKQLELERLRAENDLKEMLMGEIGAERRTLIQEQGALERQLLELGPDPFAQSAALSGQVVRGTTPQQAAVGQAQAFIDQPIPTLDFNMTPAQMQAQLGTLQGIEAPTLTGGFGLPSLAHGGVIEMEKKAGVKSLTGKKAFLVGDGAGVIPGVTEVLTVGDGKIEVTPFAGGAQEGLRIGAEEIMPFWRRATRMGREPFTDPHFWRAAQASGPMTPEQTSLFQGLQPLFQGLGLNKIPTRTMFGQTGETITSNFGALSKLGIQPEFVRDVLTGEIWQISGGTRRRINNLETLAAAQLDPASVVGAYGGEIQRMAPTLGPEIRDLPSTQQVPSGPTPAFQALGGPLIEPTTGALLPAAFKIARNLGQWQRERPDLFSNALSAFRAAGLDPFTVLAQMQAATPTGRFGRPQRIGFTGTRL